MRKNLRRISHLLAGSRRLRRQAKAFTNFAQILQIRSIFEKYCIDLLLDVGANAGQFAGEMRAFYKGEILSFEPVSSAFADLKQAASGDPGWKCYPWALGSSTATRTIHVVRSSQLSSFLPLNANCAEHFGQGAAEVGQEQVLIRRLDDALEEVAPSWQGRSIFLKLDTQGFDLEVFRGLGEQGRHIRALQSEVSVIPIYEEMLHWTESVTLYEQEGFQLAGMFPVELDALQVMEFDCLMIRP